MRTPLFLVICLAVAALVFAGAVAVGNDYVFFAGYVILQYVVLSTAWNILGGYCGYVNFGSAAFFALGAYSTVAIYKLMGANDLPHLVPMPALMASRYSPANSEVIRPYIANRPTTKAGQWTVRAM